MVRLRCVFGWVLLAIVEVTGASAEVNAAAAPAADAAAGSIEVAVRLNGPGGVAAAPIGAVVWVAGFPAQAAASAAAAPAVVTWSTAKVAPSATVVRIPGRVDFVNADAVAHDLFSGADGSPFTDDLTTKGERATASLDRPGQVPIYCNDHPREEAYLVAADGDPRSADAAGVVRFDGVPAGLRNLRVWSPGGPLGGRDVEVVAGETIRVELVVEAPAKRPPHPDKSGRPYPKVPGSIEARVTRGGEAGEGPAVGAVAWLVGSPKPHRPGYRAVAATAPAVAARDKKFEPRLEVVPVGRKVEFPNYNRIFHNVFSLSETKKFDLGLYKNGKSVGVDFNRPGVVKVYCNIHPKMVAFVVVVDGENVARVGDDGIARLEGVPSGTWTLKVWDELGGEWSGEVEVATAASSTVAVSLQPGGSRSDEHLNKYGEEYANPDDEESRY